jgi:hypothetical protein
MLESLFGAPAVGCMFRIGYGKAGDSARLQRRPQIVHRSVGLQDRAVRRHQHDAAFRVEIALVPGEAVLVKIGDEFLVGSHEDLEGCALADLGGEVAGGAEGELHVLAGVGLEGCSERAHGKLQVGSRGDDGPVRLLGIRASHLCRETCERDPSPEAK